MTVDHLARLSSIAEADHREFTARRPEFRDRRVLVVLAQGAAQHWVDGVAGVKDLDVWTYYRAIPGAAFPASKRVVHRDFGP